MYARVCVHAHVRLVYVCVHAPFVCVWVRVHVKYHPGSHSHIPLCDQLLSTRSTQQVSVDANWRVVEVTKGKELFLGYD